MLSKQCYNIEKICLKQIGASKKMCSQRAVIFAPLQKNGIVFFYKDNQNKRKKTITLKVDSEL